MWLLTFKSILLFFNIMATVDTNHCNRFIRKHHVNFNVSDCFSYDTYDSPKPAHLCVLKCHTIPGCIATGIDSVHMTSTCCTLVKKKIRILAGSSAIIHQAKFNVCLGSEWTGEMNRAGDRYDMTLKFRFQGLANNCSQFTGTNYIVTDHPKC